MANDTQKKWPLLYSKFMVSGVFVLFFEVSLFRFSLVSFILLSSHLPRTTHARSSSLQFTHQPPICHNLSITLILIVHSTAFNHWKSTHTRPRHEHLIPLSYSLAYVIHTCILVICINTLLLLICKCKIIDFLRGWRSNPLAQLGVSMIV